MLIAKPAFHVGAVFLLPKVDFCRPMHGTRFETCGKKRNDKSERDAKDDAGAAQNTVGRARTWCGANELQLDRSRDWFICQVRLPAQV